MNKKMRSLYLIFMAVTPFFLIGCKGSNGDQEPVRDTVIIYTEQTPASETEMQVPDQPAPVAKPVVRKTVEPAKEEVMYISGHGANGRVWGHITMKGSKGYGSVTDEHENALSVTCTRQGEELICYDQNSRQYIFRL